jgi:NitT/TauT family transport system ATP-binding protein
MEAGEKRTKAGGGFMSMESGKYESGGREDYLRQSPEVAARFATLRERPTILQVNGLGRTFGSHAALQNISFEVRRREFISVLGASGCGKSTLIRIVAGLENPTAGEILLDGKAIHGPGPDRGMVFQGYTLFPWLSVKKNVMFGLQMSGKSAFDAESEAREWIALVGLSKFENAYPHQLSGGMKQRVAIARALANRPRILLMDEPFGALDAQTRAQMQSYLLEIWRNVDVTILFITHDLDEAVYLSDRILVLGTNPSRVLEVIENPVPRPRSREQFISTEFLATYRRIAELIHPPGAESQERVHIPRMTMAGDDVE